MIKEHDRVVLTESVPAEGLEPGDVGTVVHVYADGKAYEVEFVALDGHTRAVATLEVRQIRPVSRDDMTHARDSDGLRPMAGSKVRKDGQALRVSFVAGEQRETFLGTKGDILNCRGNMPRLWRGGSPGSFNSHPAIGSLQPGD